MHRLVSYSLRGVSVLVLSALLSSAAQAQDSRARTQRPRPAVRVIPTFNVSGVFAGISAGQISIDGVFYRVNPNMQVYQIGRGLLSVNALPIGGRIFASGRGTVESGSIEAMIARPSNEGAGQPGDDSSSIRERVPHPETR